MVLSFKLAVRSRWWEEDGRLRRKEAVKFQVS